MEKETVFGIPLYVDANGKIKINEQIEKVIRSNRFENPVKEIEYWMNPQEGQENILMIKIITSNSNKTS